MKQDTSFAPCFSHNPLLKAQQRCLLRALNLFLDCALSTQNPKILFPNGLSLLPGPLQASPSGSFSHQCMHPWARRLLAGVWTKLGHAGWGVLTHGVEARKGQEEKEDGLGQLYRCMYL